MIKFFRKIRQDLLMENKTGKYFKYAIGEIVLVVIGILIALQINNWNGNLKQQQKEHILLTELNKEFRANKIQLDSVLLYHKRSKKSNDYLLSRLPIKDVSQENLDSLSYNMWYNGDNYTFNPSNGVTSSIMNSTSINIISNNELRQLLIGWNDVLLDYQEEEEIAMNNYHDQLKPFEKKYFHYAPNKYEWLKDPRVDLSILKSLEFDNYVQDRYYNLDNILNNNSGELENLIYTIDKIIELSDPENYD